jgi:polyphosphate kinase
MLSNLFCNLENLANSRKLSTLRVMPSTINLVLGIMRRNLIEREKQETNIMRKLNCIILT